MIDPTVPAHSRSALVSRRAAMRGGLLAGLGLAGAALLGCGDDEEESEGSEASATAPGASPSSSVAAGSSALPDEFVLANESEPADLLPWFANFGSALVTRQVYQTMWEPRLTVVNGRPTWERVPVLARSFEQTGPTTWRLALREGVRFHNGEPWNADAAVASFELLSNPDLIKELKRSSILGGITRFQKVDDMTVDVETRAPGVDAIATAMRLGYSGLPAKAIAGDGWRSLAEHPIGTGPIRITAFNRGSDIQGEAFEDYWGKKFPIRRVRWITRPEPSVRALTVKTGEAHFAFNIGSEPAQQLEHWVAAAGFQTNMVRMNNTRAPFTDVRVRKAANYAIDRDEIARAVFRGTAEPTGFFAYAPSNAKPFPFDPKRARALLEEAGAAGASVELVYGEFRLPEEEALAEIFQGYLNAAGFRASIRRVEKVAYAELSAAEFEQQPQMLMESTSSGNYGEVLGSLDDKFGCNGSGTYCNEALEARWTALRTRSIEERDREVAEIARILQEEDSPRIFVAVVKQVHGLAPFFDPAALPVNLYPLFDDFRFA